VYKWYLQLDKANVLKKKKSSKTVVSGINRTAHQHKKKKNHKRTEKAVFLEKEEDRDKNWKTGGYLMYQPAFRGENWKVKDQGNR